MAIIKKKDLASMSAEDRKKKMAEIERAMLELAGEGRYDKVRPLKKAMAQLLTPPAGKMAKSQKPQESVKKK